MYLASKYGHKNMIDVLVENGADCKIPDNVSDKCLNCIHWGKSYEYH